MDAVQDIVERAKRLPPADRRRVVDLIEHDLPPDDETHETTDAEELERRRLAALDAFLARAGTVHSDFTDVSSNKHKHLAEIYADNHLPADTK